MEILKSVHSQRMECPHRFQRSYPCAEQEKLAPNVINLELVPVTRHIQYAITERQ